MALTPESGAGVAGADSYASQATIDAYWAARPHDPNAAVWAALDSDEKDGAARESTGYIDAICAMRYRGKRAGYIQGLEWPRTGALDDEGYELPALPQQLVDAVCELAPRASAARLMKDAEVSGVVKRTLTEIGPITEEIEYSHGTTDHERYGIVDHLLAPLLKDTTASAAWAWA